TRFSVSRILPSPLPLGGEGPGVRGLRQRRFFAMDRGAIKTLVIQLIEDDIGERFENLDDDKDLRKDLGLDSVDLVSIVSQIERRFKIRLAQEELEKLITVKDVLDLLEVKFADIKEAA